MEPIRRLAIVNRGEAAMRCIRTVKALRAHEDSELRVVALYTDPDRDAPYVRHADFALRLPPRATPVASYLDHDLLLAALAQVQADAVWPGWGFVAESAEFVDRLNGAGIRFLGPSGDTMRRLGDKIASKQLAERLSVPVTPWSQGAVPTAEDATRWAEKLGLPLVLKASAGGGGRGIRMIEDFAKLPAQFQSATSEAIGAFGDGRLFLERMVRGGRHVEVQIVADRHGFVRAVGCRDCSVQRRHQKVIEEAPPIGLAPELLQSMMACAERLAREVRYAGVGTVEFLVEPSGAFFFMEMNPRLQVEHGITEEITGLDLVELQIRIARGEQLDGLTVSSEGFCIEARVCAEDPDQGFLPAPGEIARFDPATGPHLRIDTGVVQGSTVPAAFDSLIAKVMARGDTRPEARARLCAALRDFDLVIHGGASNKSYLLEILDADGYKAGGIDTLWLDRYNAARSGLAEHASQALVLAAVLSYRAQWQAERRNFFADTSTITPDRVPALEGRELDLEYRGESYRARVFSVGSWRYRVHMDGHVVSARFGDVGPNTARVVISARYYRASYDVTDAHIRIEIEGCVHRFGRQTAGQVRAGAPSMVVSVDVVPGQRVSAGQHLGLLEAMKMEIGFSAPVAGVVTEVRVAKGAQVAAGDVLLVIDPGRDEGAAVPAGARIRLPEEVDPLAPLFKKNGSDNPFGVPDLRGADATPQQARTMALREASREVQRMMLGWDVYGPRFEKLLEFLESDLPDGLSEAFRSEMSSVRQGLIIFADVEQLFSHARHVEEGGTLGPSSNARLRVYLRRMHSQGAGIARDFMDMLRAALRHYDVHSLEYTEELERAVLRMFAAQRDPTHRRRLVMAALRRLMALVASGISLADDPLLRDALIRIAALRGEVSNALADTALELEYRAYQGSELARQAEIATRRLEAWLASAEAGSQSASPPADVIEDLAVAPSTVFARVDEWLSSTDRWKRMVALSAYVRRLYAPRKPDAHRSEQLDGRWIDRSRYGGRVVLAALCSDESLPDVARALNAAARDGLAIELIVPASEERDPAPLVERMRVALGTGLAVERATLSVTWPGGAAYRTLGLVDGKLELLPLHGLHPETAARVDLSRYANFALERMWGPEDIYCFHARARGDEEDERIFVLVDVRARPSAEGHSAELFTPIFERAFQEAARAMRLNLGIVDPRRVLQWNRLVIHMAHPVSIDPMTAQRLARKLLSNIRHLGIEKTIVRLKLANADRPQEAPREIEVVGSDVASSRLELSWRRPRRQPLVPATPLERKVAEARRRGLVYPYEIIKMLTTGDEARERVVEEVADRDRRPVLPVGSFEEYDLDANSRAPLAVSVAGRPPGQAKSAIVFGLISTVTRKVPEGMRRVLVLSDPTRGLGALAGPECDRVVAAIDLAERLSLPVEWIPVSSGARIAMDSGTENLDATARVVRRIVTFTQNGGAIHIIVTGVNIGAQSYWNALSTMLMHTKGVLIMTPQSSMVLTGAAALAASGSVGADDEVDIGGHERVMGPNGQAQYFATDLLSAYQILYRYYGYSYVVPGEVSPRKHPTTDARDRDIRTSPYGFGPELALVGDVFDEEKNPGRKRPFAMRAVMRGLIDSDGGHLERWSSHVGAETAIIWDAHLGGHPVCMIGIESHNLPRLGYRPSDGPEEWNGGTLFPQSSKKIARALNAASGNRPALILANLSGFDGSPESMRKLQLEYGAEIARAVVNFRGPILFLVVSRYHGGAYVVFSRELTPSLRAMAVEGSYASVIGGGPAAAVVFARDVRARVAADPRIEALRQTLQNEPSAEQRAEFDKLRRDVTTEKRTAVAAEFDAIHTVERAKKVGSLSEILSADRIRPRLIELLDQAQER